MSSAIQDTPLAISQMFCISPYTCQLVFKVCCKWRSEREREGRPLLLTMTTTFFSPSPLLDRLIRKTQGRVRSQLEAGNRQIPVKRKVLPLAWKTSLCCPPHTEIKRGKKGNSIPLLCYGGRVINCVGGRSLCIQ